MGFCLPSHSIFYLALNVFFFALCTKLGLPHLLAIGLIHCICGQPLDLILGDPSFSLFPWWGRHYIPWCYSTFVFITNDVGFYVSCEQIHVLLSPSLQPIRQWVDIVWSNNDIHILIDVVIVDPTQVEWVLCVVSSGGVIKKMITQIKRTLLWSTFNGCVFFLL